MFHHNFSTRVRQIQEILKSIKSKRDLLHFKGTSRFGMSGGRAHWIPDLEIILVCMRTRPNVKIYSAMVRNTYTKY